MKKGQVWGAGPTKSGKMVGFRVLEVDAIRSRAHIQLVRPKEEFGFKLDEAWLYFTPAGVPLLQEPCTLVEDVP